ncbi:MAG: hypothetical protein R2796_05180 [Chitinophagaceae bacterium]
MTLSKKEQDFLDYWKKNRDKKKKVLRQLYVGFPLAVLLIVAIFINMFSGWFKKADMILHQENFSFIIILIIASLAIIAFIVIFSARYRWEQNEQAYRELLVKKNKE